MNLRILAILAVLLASGCASTPFSGPPTYVPQPVAGQEMRENRYAGGYALQSTGARSVARMQQMLGDNLEEHGALFKVVVVNTGLDALTIDLASLQASRAGKPIPILDHDAVAKLEEAKKASGNKMGSILSVGAVVGGALSAAVIGYSGGGNLSQQQIDSSSQAIGAGVASSMEASSKAKEGAAVASDARLELFDLLSLQAGTVPPGGTWGGYFIVEASRLTTEPTLIVLKLGNDEHRFSFKPKLF